MRKLIHYIILFSFTYTQTVQAAGIEVSLSEDRNGAYHLPLQQVVDSTHPVTFLGEDGTEIATVSFLGGYQVTSSVDDICFIVDEDIVTPGRSWNFDVFGSIDLNTQIQAIGLSLKHGMYTIGLGSILNLNTLAAENVKALTLLQEVHIQQVMVTNSLLNIGADLEAVNLIGVSGEMIVEEGTDVDCENLYAQHLKLTIDENARLNVRDLASGIFDLFNVLGRMHVHGLAQIQAISGELSGELCAAHLRLLFENSLSVLGEIAFGYSAWFESQYGVYIDGQVRNQFFSQYPHNAIKYGDLYTPIVFKAGADVGVYNLVAAAVSDVRYHAGQSFYHTGHTSADTEETQNILANAKHNSSISGVLSFGDSFLLKARNRLETVIAACFKGQLMNVQADTAKYAHTTRVSKSFRSETRGGTELASGADGLQNTSQVQVTSTRGDVIGAADTTVGAAEVGQYKGKRVLMESEIAGAGTTALEGEDLVRHIGDKLNPDSTFFLKSQRVVEAGGRYRGAYFVDVKKGIYRVLHGADIRTDGGFLEAYEFDHVQGGTHLTSNSVHKFGWSKILNSTFGGENLRHSSYNFLLAGSRMVADGAVIDVYVNSLLVGNLLVGKSLTVNADCTHVEVANLDIVGRRITNAPLVVASGNMRLNIQRDVNSLFCIEFLNSGFVTYENITAFGVDIGDGSLLKPFVDCMNLRIFNPEPYVNVRGLLSGRSLEDFLIEARSGNIRALLADTHFMDAAREAWEVIMKRQSASDMTYFHTKAIWDPEKGFFDQGAVSVVAGQTVAYSAVIGGVAIVGQPLVIGALALQTVMSLHNITSASHKTFIELLQDGTSALRPSRILQHMSSAKDIKEQYVALREQALKLALQTDGYLGLNQTDAIYKYFGLEKPKPQPDANQADVEKPEKPDNNNEENEGEAKPRVLSDENAWNILNYLWGDFKDEENSGCYFDYEWHEASIDNLADNPIIAPFIPALKILLKNQAPKDIIKPMMKGLMACLEGRPVGYSNQNASQVVNKWFNSNLSESDKGERKPKDYKSKRFDKWCKEFLFWDIEGLLLNPETSLEAAQMYVLFQNKNPKNWKRIRKEFGELQTKMTEVVAPKPTPVSEPASNIDSGAEPEPKLLSNTVEMPQYQNPLMEVFQSLVPGSLTVRCPNGTYQRANGFTALGQVKVSAQKVLNTGVTVGGLVHIECNNELDCGDDSGIYHVISRKVEAGGHFRENAQVTHAHRNEVTSKGGDLTIGTAQKSHGPETVLQATNGKIHRELDHLDVEGSHLRLTGNGLPNLSDILRVDGERGSYEGVRISDYIYAETDGHVLFDRDMPVSQAKSFFFAADSLDLAQGVLIGSGEVLGLYAREGELHVGAGARVQVGDQESGDSGVLAMLMAEKDVVFEHEKTTQKGKGFAKNLTVNVQFLDTNVTGGDGIYYLHTDPNTGEQSVRRVGVIIRSNNGKVLGVGSEFDTHGRSDILIAGKFGVKFEADAEAVWRKLKKNRRKLGLEKVFSGEVSTTFSQVVMDGAKVMVVSAEGEIELTSGVFKEETFELLSKAGTRLLSIRGVTGKQRIKTNVLGDLTRHLMRAMDVLSEVSPVFEKIMNNLPQQMLTSVLQSKYMVGTESISPIIALDGGRQFNLLESIKESFTEFDLTPRIFVWGDGMSYMWATTGEVTSTAMIVAPEGGVLIAGNKVLLTQGKGRHTFQSADAQPDARLLYPQSVSAETANLLTRVVNSLVKEGLTDGLKAANLGGEVSLEHRTTKGFEEFVADEPLIKARDLVLSAEDVVRLDNGTSLKVLGDFDVLARALVQNGAKLHHKVQSMGLAIFARGTTGEGISAGVRAGQSREKGHTWLAGSIDAQGHARIHLTEWRQNAGNFRAHSASGHVEHFSSRTRNDHVSALHMNASASVTGDVSFNFGCTKTREATHQSGVTVITDSTLLFDAADTTGADLHNVHVTKHRTDALAKQIDRRGFDVGISFNVFAPERSSVSIGVTDKGKGLRLTIPLQTLMDLTSGKSPEAPALYNLFDIAGKVTYWDSDAEISLDIPVITGINLAALNFAQAPVTQAPTAVLPDSFKLEQFDVDQEEQTSPGTTSQVGETADTEIALVAVEAALADSRCASLVEEAVEIRTAGGGGSVDMSLTEEDPDAMTSSVSGVAAVVATTAGQNILKRLDNFTLLKLETPVNINGLEIYYRIQGTSIYLHSPELFESIIQNLQKVMETKSELGLLSAAEYRNPKTPVVILKDADKNLVKNLERGLFRSNGRLPKNLPHSSQKMPGHIIYIVGDVDHPRLTYFHEAGHASEHIRKGNAIPGCSPSGKIVDLKTFKNYITAYAEEVLSFIEKHPNSPLRDSKSRLLYKPWDYFESALKQYGFKMTEGQFVQALKQYQKGNLLSLSPQYSEKLREMYRRIEIVLVGELPALATDYDAYPLYGGRSGILASRHPKLHKVLSPRLTPVEKFRIWVRNMAASPRWNKVGMGTNIVVGTGLTILTYRHQLEINGGDHALATQNTALNLFLHGIRGKVLTKLVGGPVTFALMVNEVGLSLVPSQTPQEIDQVCKQYDAWAETNLTEFGRIVAPHPRGEMMIVQMNKDLASITTKIVDRACDFITEKCPWVTIPIRGLLRALSAPQNINVVGALCRNPYYFHVVRGEQQQECARLKEDVQVE